LVLGRVWGSACTLLTLWLLARHLAPDAFGRYTFYLAIFVVLDTLADFGSGQIAVQRTAHDAEALPEVLAAARAQRLVMGLLGVLLAGSAAFVFRESGAGWILLASLYPVTHVLELSTVVLRNRIAWGIPVALRAIASALSLAFVLALRAAGESEPARYICAVAAGSALANVLLYLACRAHLPRRRASAIPLKSFFLAAAPLGLASLCQQAYFYVDNLFVRSICGTEELGRYNIGVRVMSYSIMVAIYSGQAALPWLARAHARGELGQAVGGFVPRLFALAALAAGLAAPWAGELLALFGEPFRAAAPSLRWLLVAGAFVYAGAGLMTALVASGGARSILAIALAALGVNLLANTLLVPRFASEGAGMATALTEAAVVAGALIALRRGGARGMLSERPLLWALAPLAFAAGWLASGALHAALVAA
jgi:PST family polysaccharide transporter